MPLLCITAAPGHRAAVLSCEVEYLPPEQLFACDRPSEPIFRPVRHRLPLPSHKEITYFKRILQKQPKLLPFGTSPAYDIVMLNALNF